MIKPHAQGSEGSRESDESGSKPKEAECCNEEGEPCEEAHSREEGEPCEEARSREEGEPHEEAHSREEGEDAGAKTCPPTDESPEASRKKAVPVQERNRHRRYDRHRIHGPLSTG